MDAERLIDALALEEKLNEGLCEGVPEGVTPIDSDCEADWDWLGESLTAAY